MEYAQQELKEVLSDIFSISTEEVNDETSIDTVEVWDSLKHLELVLALEGKFNISFSTQDTIEILNYPLIKMTLEKYGIHFNQEPCVSDNEKG